MASRSEYPRATRGEKHGWLRFDRYQEIHEGTLDRHPFVIEDRTEFERAEDSGGVSYRLEGDILCTVGIVIEVSKYYHVRRRRGYEEIRGVQYRYTARVPGSGNIVRYDNLHLDTPDEYHRHVYDLATWSHIEVQLLKREDFPTLGEVLEEVMHLASEAGLLDAP